MKLIAQKLEAEMAKAISLIVAASHAAAVEVLNEAFGLEEQRLKQKAESHRPESPTKRTQSTPRRSAAEIQALEERFFQAVWDGPGETMSVLAVRLDAKPAELQVPVARLKAHGRIKTVGERQFTRYFPIRGSDSGDGKADE